MKIIKKMFCVVIIVAMILCGCDQKREARKDSASEQEQIKELCVFYTPDNEILIKNFENLYPEYKLEKVIMTGNIEDEINKGRIPDLIIAEGSTALMDWYERGFIQELGSYLGEDVNIKDEDYFPGALSVGREADILLALPISVRVQYMTVRDSVAGETTFGDLSEEYTLDEYLHVLTEEYSGIPEKGTMVVSGIPFCYNLIDLLFITGAITIEEGSVEIDQSIFEKLYQICIENCRNYQEEASVALGVYRNAAIDPRDGEHKAAYWYNSPPQIEVLYAQSVNRQLLDEDIDVFWWPMAGEAGRYAAEITTLGMIGAESENPQVAYEVLRLMMDMPVKELIQPQRVDSMSIEMYMPVHVENAKELCTYVETNGMPEFSVISISKEYEFVEKQAWDEELKEKVLNMLDGIQYVYRLDSSIYVSFYADVMSEYFGELDVEGAADCYEDAVNYLQKKINHCSSTGWRKLLCVYSHGIYASSGRSFWGIRVYEILH